MRRHQHHLLNKHAVPEHIWQRFKLHPHYNKLLIYSWLLIIAIVFIGTIIDGTGFSFGVFFKHLEADLNLNRALASAIFSLNILLSSTFGLMGGWALDKYGPRRVLFLMGIFTGASLLLTSQVNASWQLFLTYSLLLAVGSGPVYTVTNSIVMRTFKKEQGLLIGIANAGEGLGLIVMAPVATLLIANYDWSMAYLIIGIVALVTVIPVSFFVKQTPVESATQEEPNQISTNQSIPDTQGDEGGLSIAQAAKTRSFWLFAGTGVLLVSGIHLVFAHIVPHATDLGLGEEQAAFTMSLMGITSIIGGMLLGLVSDKIGRKKTAVFCCLLQVACLVLLIPADSLWSLYLVACMFGVAFGGIMATLTPLVGFAFGTANIGKLLGCLDFSFAFAALIGPLLAGFVYDSQGNYNFAFAITAGAAVVAALFLSQVRCETSVAAYD